MGKVGFRPNAWFTGRQQGMAWPAAKSRRMDIALMLEGQNGLNWSRWKAIVQRAEALGFAGVFRSDHYTNPSPPDLDSLELWVSLTWLAGNTKRLLFGPIVSPVSFREPTMTARMAAAVDDLAGGRLILGMGAGWQEREHHNYGFNLLDLPARFKRFEEGLQVVTRLLRSDTPFDFDGEFYHLHEALLMPRPARRTPILIGGNGKQRTLRLAAQYADEWNGVFIPAAQFKDLSATLDGYLRERGRAPASVTRSLMQGVVCAPTEAGIGAKLEARGLTSRQGRQSPAELRERGVLVGTPEEVAEQLQPYREAGVQRIMLQWLELDDLEGLEAMARAVIR